MKEIVTTMNNTLVQSLMKLLDCYLVSIIDTENKKVSIEEIEAFENTLEQLFYFCLVWSVGATGDYESREKFNAFLI